MDYSHGCGGQHGDEQLALKRLKRQVDRVTQKSDAQSTDATLMSFLHSSNLVRIISLAMC